MQVWHLARQVNLASITPAKEVVKCSFGSISSRLKQTVCELIVHTGWKLLLKVDSVYQKFWVPSLENCCVMTGRLLWWRCGVCDIGAEEEALQLFIITVCVCVCVWTGYSQLEVSENMMFIIVQLIEYEELHWWPCYSSNTLYFYIRDRISELAKCPTSGYTDQTGLNASIHATVCWTLL